MMEIFDNKQVDVKVHLAHLDNTDDEDFTPQNFDRALQNAFTTINVFILILIMIAMGAKMKLKHIRNHVKKPLGPLAGFVSQFVIMPLVSFMVAHLLKLEPEHAIGALIMACSPGGVMSNMVTYYTKGDCSLSITMTTLSTLMAFGMMPSNLWLYTRNWTKGHLSTTLSMRFIKVQKKCFRHHHVHPLPHHPVLTPPHPHPSGSRVSVRYEVPQYAHCRGQDRLLLWNAGHRHLHDSLLLHELQPHADVQHRHLDRNCHHAHIRLSHFSLVHQMTSLYSHWSTK